MIESRALRRRIICLMLALILAALPAIAGARALYPGATPTTEYTALDDQRKAQIPLVNYAHTLPDDFTLPQVKGRAQGDYAVAGGFSPLVNLYEQRHSFRLAGSDIWLCQHVYAAMERMFAAAEAEGMNGFIITSGYRSRERQQEIYAETEPGLAATPGASEHETGLSFDVTAYSDNGDFGSTPQYAWLIANCWQYGFILRYPAGTQDITGITGESWHFRYVGQDAAQEILARDITLEQYLEGITLEPLSTAGVWASYEAGPAAAAEPTLQPADQAASGSTALPARAHAPARSNARAAARNAMAHGLGHARTGSGTYIRTGGNANAVHGRHLRAPRWRGGHIPCGRMLLGAGKADAVAGRRDSRDQRLRQWHRARARLPASVRRRHRPS